MEASRTAVARALELARANWSIGGFVLVAGVLGGFLIALSEFLTVFSVDVLTSGTCAEIADPSARDACSTSGFEQHGGAFLLLGLLAIPMAIGAGRRASRPAASALVAIAAITLVFAALRDLPDSRETGLVGIKYEKAETSHGAGLYLEVLGAGLVLLTGVTRLTRRDSRQSTDDSR